MITSKILGVLVTLAEALLGIIPDVSLPSWLSDLPGQAATAGESVAPFTRWLPIVVMMQVGGGLVTVWLVLLAVRGVRRVISLFTGGGG